MFWLFLSKLQTNYTGAKGCFQFSYQFLIRYMIKALMLLWHYSPHNEIMYESKCAIQEKPNIISSPTNIIRYTRMNPNQSVRHGDIAIYHKHI